ncbi:CinA family protein [Metamycoplasma buccale]|uniref:CinA family protein n=1 Tax=Metamycoplasma buccale TaxID=55602 RepID=UPI00398F860F
MKNKTLSAVESFTGGLFCSTIVNKPGASSYFLGGMITYNSNIKAKLGIDISNGVINNEVAKQMAIKGREFFNSDFCVSFTGNAGPNSMENKPVGLIYIAINEEVWELNLKGTRNKIRALAVKFALKKLREKGLQC